MADVSRRPDGARLDGPLTVWTVAQTAAQLEPILRQTTGETVCVDLGGLTRLDPAGAAYLQRLPVDAQAWGRQVQLTPLPATLAPLPLPAGSEAPVTARLAPGGLERLGGAVLELNRNLARLAYLAADLTWEATAALVRRRGVRPGTFTDQAVAMGPQAVPIVALILFLIGAVSTLQAAAQLRQFGASIYVANLLAIGITRELGPLMTAIVVAGRTGAAIAAELATMKLNEELAALQTMGILPLRFVAVPKLWAMVVCVPLLTVLADAMGLLGGTTVAVLYMGLAPEAFVDQALAALMWRDIVAGLIKSLSYAWVVTVIGVYCGLGCRGGATGVGQATTAAVVRATFAIIVVDCFWGLAFYLR